MSIKFGFKPSGKYPKLKLAVDRALEKMLMLDKKNHDRVKDIMESFGKEEDLVNFLITPMSFYTEPGHEPKKEVLDAYIKKYRLIVSEHFHCPHLMMDENGNGVLTSKLLSAYPLYIRSNQQIALKEGKSAKEDTSRNITGQVSGKKSKSGAFTDAEITVAISHHADNVMRELLGAGSHDMEAKKAVKAQIYKTGEASLKEVPNESKDKKSLILFDEIFKGLGIDTDLISTPLEK